MFIAFISGRWSDGYALFPLLQEMMEQSEYGIMGVNCEKGFNAFLHIAVAREDSNAIDTTVAALNRLYPDATSLPRLLMTALLTDEIPKIEDGFSDEHKEIKEIALAFYNEHGIPVPEAFVEQLHDPGWRHVAALDYLAIAEALAADDNEKLAEAIDKAEEHHLIVHAARMRIVLAQRTRDKAHLEKARQVLEKLGDRHFLSRLQEVEAALASHAAA